MSLTCLTDEGSTAGESFFLEKNENGIGEFFDPRCPFFGKSRLKNLQLRGILSALRKRTKLGGSVMKYTAAVITISDKGSRGERVDTSGPAVCRMLEDAGFEVVYTNIIPDEMEQIKAELTACADDKKIGLVMTTGGTGFSQRDITPEATLAVVERETRGIPEAMRWASLQITPRGCLSRSAAGIRGKTLIVNLPGSEKAAKENLAAVLEAIVHGMDMLFSDGSTDHDHEHHHHHDHAEHS